MSRGRFLIFLLVEFIFVMGALVYLYTDTFVEEQLPHPKILEQNTPPEPEPNLTTNPFDHNQSTTKGIEQKTWSMFVWEHRDEMCAERVPDTYGIVFFYPCFIYGNRIKKEAWYELCWDDTDLYLNKTCYGYVL